MSPSRSSRARRPRTAKQAASGAPLAQQVVNPQPANARITEPASAIVIRVGFHVLRAAAKLGAVLLQFPFSFHRAPETMAYLASLLKRFADYPLVVEVRHASWSAQETFDLLHKSGAGFCNIDQPIIGRSL